MRKMTKLAAMGLLGATILGATAFASDSIKTPAEIYSGLKGITVDEAYDQRDNNKTFGQLAEEAGKLDEFQSQMLESRKAIIEQRVTEGTLTRERADELLKAIEAHECTGSGEQRLGKQYGVGFGRGANGCGNGQGLHLQDGTGMGRGFGRGNGGNTQ